MNAHRRMTPFAGLILCLLPAHPVRADPPETVAIAYQLSGKASVAIAGGSARPLGLLDRLPVAATVSVGPHSRLALAFVSGKRYELSGPADATLARGDLAGRSGAVRPLPPLPPLPLLSPIAEDDHPGRAMGAVRLRGERITGLYPHRGATVLAAATVLSFPPVPGAQTYQISVLDARGSIVFTTATASPPVRVPLGRLQPGASYRWTVSTLDRPIAVAQGQAELVTLPEASARDREKARRILAAEGPSALPLLAEIDRSFGLLSQARDDLMAALDAGASERALPAALAAIEGRIKDDGNDPF